MLAKPTLSAKEGKLIEEHGVLEHPGMQRLRMPTKPVCEWMLWVFEAQAKPVARATLALRSEAFVDQAFQSTAVFRLGAVRLLALRTCRFI